MAAPHGDMLSEDQRHLIEIHRIKALDRLNKKRQTRCCSCGSTGRCVRCSCVLSGQSCSNCTPSSSDHCSNQGNPKTVSDSFKLDDDDGVQPDKTGSQSSNMCGINEQSLDQSCATLLTIPI